jgi:hypothetical protein
MMMFNDAYYHWSRHDAYYHWSRHMLLPRAVLYA